MNPQEPQDRAQEFLREADARIRANPVPAVLAALAVGFAIGLLTRPEPPRREPLHDALDEMRALLAKGAKKGRSAYAHSAEAVREAVEEAVDKACEIDTDPLAKWWKRLWS